MMQTIAYIQNKAENMIEGDRDRDRMFRSLDKMSRGEWDIPAASAEIKEYLVKHISTDPANAEAAAVKILSVDKPHIDFAPMGPNPEDKDIADKIERVLAWELDSASRRSPTKVVPDIIRSAIRYGEVCVHVDYLPFQMQAAGHGKPRLERAMRLGQFAIKAYNPLNVHSRYNDYGLESVVGVSVMTGQEIVDYWGRAADKIAKEIAGEDDDVWYVVYDYSDENQRLVWATPGETVSTVLDENYILVNEENKKGFISWVVRYTGSGLDDDAAYSRKPFLETVYRGNLWNRANELKTLVSSEVLAYAAAPRGKIMGPGGELVSVDYGSPGKNVILKPGQEYIPLNPPTIDTNILQMYDRTIADIQAATAIQVLYNLNFPAGTAYASINAVLQTVIASLQPNKVLAQDAIADICELMMLWVDYARGEFLAYDRTSEGVSKEYSVSYSDYSIRRIYITVDLNANAPTDMMERINAGMLLLQMGFPKARVFKTLNVNDAEQAVIERYFEDMTDQEIQLDAEMRKFEMMQMMQQPQAPPGGMPQMPGMPPPGAEGFINPEQAAMQNVSGSGVNPNMGGVPPAEFAPGLTREQISGNDMSGNPILY